MKRQCILNLTEQNEPSSQTQPRRDRVAATTGCDLLSLRLVCGAAVFPGAAAFLREARGRLHL